LERLAKIEKEPDACFIEHNGCVDSPLGFCCTKNTWQGWQAMRVMLERGADPTKNARKMNLRTRSCMLFVFGVASSPASDAFVLAAAHDNVSAFIMMLEYAGAPVGLRLSDPRWQRYVDRWHLRNASKLALAWVLCRRPMQREDLVEPILQRVCTIPLLNWK
jgi:hypothetical protein